MFYEEFWKVLRACIRKTSASIYFCISFFEETATHPDEEDRESIDKSDNEFSYSDDDSENRTLLIDNNSPKSKNEGSNTPSEERFFVFQGHIFFGGSVCDSLCRFTLN